MAEDFIVWLFSEGGLIGIVLIATGLFIAQAVFTFLLWRKGDENYRFKFISYTIAAATLLISAIVYIVGIMIIGDMDYGALTAMTVIFTIAACVASGLQIFFFIRDTWLKKEGGKA